jgi:RNA polymerase sigma factor (sigma-70 family)
VAVVLGTALTALAPAPAARAEAPEATNRTVADLSRYCTACWRNASLPADCWDDCTQDVFSRLMDRVDPSAWSQVLGREGEERREFVRAIDTVKKRWQRARKWAAGPVDDVDDPRDRQRQELREERAVVDRAAEELLTSRQQRILQLCFEGWSVQEIAHELKTGPERVSDEKYKAIQKLRTHLCAEGQDAS